MSKGQIASEFSLLEEYHLQQYLQNIVYQMWPPELAQTTRDRIRSAADLVTKLCKTPMT